MDYNKFSPSHRYFLASITVETEPNCYFDAISNPRWLLGMKKEIDALEKNGTWTLGNELLVVSGSIESNTRPIDLLNDTRPN